MGRRARKRQKCPKAAENIKAKDIISTLPDEVLCNVLTFLPTKYAVRTSILSKRWRHLWASVPSLEFKDDVLLFQDNAHGDSFVNFVNQVLNSRYQEARITNFTLFCHHDHDLSSISSSITTALRHNLEEITFQFYMNRIIELPQTLFICSTLVILKISGHAVIDVPESVSLPKLKTLQLFGADYMNSDTVERLFAGCPVLESLYVVRWLWDDEAPVYVVKASSLKRLVIGFQSRELLHTEEDKLDEHDIAKFKLVVDAPNLETFILIANTSGNYMMKNVSSLSNAVLEVGEAYEDILDSGYNGSDVLQLLKGMSQVKLLYLTGKTVQALKHVGNQDIPTFYSLSILVLEIDEELGWKLLHGFLKHSPNLEVLVLKKGFDQPDYQGELSQCPRGSVPKSLSFHLKVVQFWDFEGRKDELKQLRYLLKNSKVLEKVRINYSKCGVNDCLKMEVINKILKIPRGSESCQVEFS